MPDSLYTHQEHKQMHPLEETRLEALRFPPKDYWHEVVIPSEHAKKLKGVSVGYDQRIVCGGFFIFTKHARSPKVYSSISRIKVSVIKRIREAKPKSLKIKKRKK